MEGRARVIRVVDAKRTLADITLLGSEELRAVLEPLVAEADPANRQAVAGIEWLAAKLKALQDRGPPGWDLPEGVVDDSAPMDEVLLRQLLYSRAVVPVIGTGEGIRVRAGVPKVALVLEGSKRREQGVAAEEPILVSGLVVNGFDQGSLVIDVLAGDVFPGLGAMARSGTYVPAVLSVAVARNNYDDGPQLTPPEFRPGEVMPYSAEMLYALRAQLSRGLAYHLSGAGAVAALEIAASRLAAAQDITRMIVAAPTRGAPTPTQKTLKQFIGRLAESFDDISDTPDEFVFTLTPLLDIYRVGAMGAYYFTLAGSKANALRFLERASLARAEKAQAAALEREILAEVSRARHLMIIAEEILGPKRSSEISQALRVEGRADEPGAILALLKDREKELVEGEYMNRRKEWEAQTNNKCPHVKLAFRLRAVRFARESVRILGDLSAYFVEPEKRGGDLTQWIHCNNCGFRVICPHVRELIMMEEKNLPYDTIRTSLAKYAVRYSGRSDESTYSYFCRICSERLSEFTSEDRTADILGSMGQLDDYVKKVMWIEAVKAAELMKFPMPADPRQFASTAVGVCHPLLLRAEEHLLKRGRRGGTSAMEGHDPYGDEETVEPRTRLYIILFVYAYVLNLIQSSHRKYEDANRRIGFEGVRLVTGGSKMSDYADAILTTIRKKYGGIIAQIEDITNEFIAERFREAYRMVIASQGPQELVVANEASTVVSEVVSLSPLYRYVMSAARTFGSLPLPLAKKPAEIRREFETVLGRSLPEILENRATNSKSELVQRLLGVRATGHGVRRVAIEYPRGADPQYVYSDPEVNFMHRMYRIPDKVVKQTSMKALDGMVRVAEMFPGCDRRCAEESVGGREPAGKSDTITSRIVKVAPKKGASKKGAPKKNAPKKSAPGKFQPSAFMRRDPLLAAAEGALYLKSYQLFAEYMADVTSADKMAKYQERLKSLRLRERGLILFRDACSVMNYYNQNFRLSRRFGRYPVPSSVREPGSEPRMPLAYLYDENGQPHSWAHGGESIYVYSKGKQVQELTRKQIAAAVAADYAAGKHKGPLHGWSPENVKCSTCGVLLSDIGTLDAAKVRESLEALSRFEAFYSFYAARCPLGGLHDFAQDQKCSKCGISHALIFGYNQSKNIPDARAFYDKYLAKYREQRGTAVAARIAEAPRDISDPEAAAIKKYKAFANSWKHDYSLLVQAAELIGEPVAVFESIGATEGREYPDVLSGAGAPPPPTSCDSTRLLAADSDVRVFITAYNRLRFVTEFVKPPPESVELLEATAVPRHEYESLSDVLPDVFDDYSAKRIALGRFRSPEDVLLFTIESLARMALGVAGAKGTKPWVSPLGKSFAQTTLKDIVRSERLLAKNGPFNFGIFGDEDVGSGSLGFSEAPVDDFGDVGEDVLDEIEDAAGEDGAMDPFALAAVDIDPDLAEANLED